MSQPSHAPSSSTSRGSWRSGKGAGSSSRGAFSRPARGGPSKASGNAKATAKTNSRLPPFVGPVHDKAYIEATFKTKPIKQEWQDNPKSPISNFMMAKHNVSLTYQNVQMVLGNSSIWRSTVILPIPEETVVGYGDSPNKKDAERLASLCALYIVDAKDLMNKSVPTVPSKQAAKTVVPGKLTDGSIVDYERSRQFMDYYCRRFGFQKPEIEYKPAGSKSKADNWEAIMAVDNKRIGIGLGASKKVALSNCYVDVTVYLESCDPDLWHRFVEDAKTGKDLGLASTVLFQVNDTVEDHIQNLVNDVGDSTLYRNRPKVGANASAPVDPVSQGDAARYVAPNRRAATEDSLQTKSQKLLERQKGYLANPQLEKMRATRAALPVYTKSEEVLSHIRDNDVTILMAATGSGKTTQVPQLILDEMIAGGNGAQCNIVCTQPRRIAAISVASRVAAERGEHVGQSVGYQVRFDTKLPERNGSVTFCTTGIFLKRMHNALEVGRHANNLDDVTHLIVDEVHERDVDTDLLLVVLKRLLEDRKRQNKPLKIVLMSATIDPTLFQQYFADVKGQPAGVIEVPGRSFPVQKHFMDDFIPEMLSKATAGTEWLMASDLVRNYIGKELDPATLPPRIASRMRVHDDNHRDDDLDLPHPLIVAAISHVLNKSDEGHVLVFLPGWDDIVSVEKLLNDSRNPLSLSKMPGKTNIHLLHSTIPVAEQQAIFEPAPQGVRRIILATNIAETSVTIPDVVYVVDTGKVKEQRYDPERKISSLVSAWVGTSNLNQRAGRAGRHRSGEYFGILGRKRALQLQPYQTVEMKRVDLTNVVMHVKALNFPGMSVEEVLAALIEPPAEERVVAAIQALKMTGALDEWNNLTSLGRVLLQLPIEPQMGRLVLYGAFFRCLDEALTLAAILTNRDPFMSPMHMKEQAAKCKMAFSPEEFRSDALTVLRAYRQWWSLQSRGDYRAATQFCVDNFLSRPTLQMIQKIKGHILQSLYEAGILNVAARGEVADWAPRRGEVNIPPELSVNGESLPLLAALITIALQPKFALKSGDKTYRTPQDKSVIIHPSSVNNLKRGKDDFKVPSFVMESSARVEKQLIAYGEKRQNISVGSSAANAQKFIVNTTRIDPLTYVLFGAYHVQVTQRGIICDEWLPIVGRVDALDDVERLKNRMEACMLRVFEGIIQAKSKQHRQPSLRRPEREEESGDDEEDDRRDYSLSKTEIEELDMMTHDIVRILNEYSTYRISNQSQATSRAPTPIASPTMPTSRLSASTRGSLDWPSIGGGGSSKSGYSTPHNYFMSRPSTPSRLR
ncbi:hypothetical protein EUX98_g91 [Antrodiella citrinella]|uniref:RNA helicase n=1 Tax=Antrodiella citrinella TaxID=2447956 RepID=A0A4S4N844_9APHY|nr:hypothetical protein EUX98_g91 [Antrodiella citrinella]